MPRLTKADLLAKIDALEIECAQHIARQDAMQAELNALYQAQRPSRNVQAAPEPEVTMAPITPIVVIAGVRCYKVRDPRTRIVTYKPVTTADQVRQTLHHAARTHIGRIGSGA